MTPDARPPVKAAPFAEAKAVHRKRYEEKLEKMVKFLREYRTASDIAHQFGIRKSVAYERIKALEKRGFNVHHIHVRQSSSGPKSIAWRVLLPLGEG